MEKLQLNDASLTLVQNHLQHLDLGLGWLPRYATHGIIRTIEREFEMTVITTVLMFLTITKSR